MEKYFLKSVGTLILVVCLILFNTGESFSYSGFSHHAYDTFGI